MNPKLMTNDELQDVYERVADADADRLEAHLAALTAMPEDVERLHGVACDAVRESRGPGGVQRGLDAVNRLASAAARVPGLEAELDDAHRDATKMEAEITRLRRDLTASKSTVMVAFDSAEEARSERDAVLTQARKREEVNVEELLRAVTERNAARKEVEALKADALAIAQSAEEAVKEADALREQVSKLTVRVAELERETRQAHAEEAGASAHTTQNINAIADTVIARAAAIGHPRSHMDGFRDGVRTFAEAMSNAAAAPPQKGQGVCIGCDGKGYDEDVDDECKGYRFTCRSCGGTGKTPTPADLREAVGPFVRVAKVLERYGHPVHDPGHTRVPDERCVWLKQHGEHVAEVNMGNCRALLAAYDATPAAITHAQLAAVVEEYEGEQDFSRATSDDITEERAEGRKEGAREVLRRFPGGEVPEVLPKARVVAVLANHSQEPERDRQHSRAAGLTEWGRGYNNAVRGIARDLGLQLPTPPSGPGGGEPRPQTFSTTGMSGWSAKDDAPTPTPDVPPMSPVPGLAMPLPAVQEAIRQQAQPEPAAPEVVMEKDGVRVSEDGSVNLERGVSEWWALGVLGNALVEAKRELRCEHGRDKDYCAKEYEDAQERAARKAAEDMRERAARAIAQEAADTHNDAARPLLDECEVIIRALPLEDK